MADDPIKTTTGVSDDPALRDIKWRVASAPEGKLIIEIGDHYTGQVEDVVRLQGVIGASMIVKGLHLVGLSEQERLELLTLLELMLGKKVT